MSVPAMMTRFAAGLFALSLAAPVNAQPIQQLRIYEVPSANEEVFHQRFRDQAMPIMRRYGFNFAGTWRSRNHGKTEFVYLLEWPDEESMKKAWTAFMADESWKQIKRVSGAKYGSFVEKIDDRTLHPTDYSPAHPERAKKPIP